jgi:hypothetical protein
MPMILDAISFEPDVSELYHYMHIREGSEQKKEVDHLLKEAYPIARPKAMYHIGLVEKMDETGVSIDGIDFRSRILRVNLDQAHRVFAFVVTCGQEIYDWACSFEDSIERFWADGIMVSSLNVASNALNKHLDETYQPGHMAAMNPGSLEDWPMTEQIPLFNLVGNVKDGIGVELTESFLMVPTKSVSGLFFQTENGYANCQLCPRDGCPNRRAQYDPDLYNARYQIQERI